MLRTITLTAAILLASAVASAQFEGVASFKMTMGSGTDLRAQGDGKIFLGAAGYRVEWAMDLSSMRKDHERTGAAPATMAMTMLARKADPGKLYMLNDEKKTYSIIDPGQAENRGMPKDTFTVKKLGTATVAGVSCQNALLTSSKSIEIEVCVAKELTASTDWLASLNRRSPEGTSWLAALKEQGIEGFPVRWVIRKTGSTQPLTTLEMTRIEKKSLAASLFEVPPGYTQTKSAMQGLTPEQRKAYEDAKKRYAQPTPTPRP